MIGYPYQEEQGHWGCAPRNKALKAKARPPGSGGSDLGGIPWNKEVSNGDSARYRSAN